MRSSSATICSTTCSRLAFLSRTARSARSTSFSSPRARASSTPYCASPAFRTLMASACTVSSYARALLAKLSTSPLASCSPACSFYHISSFPHLDRCGDARLLRAELTIGERHLLSLLLGLAHLRSQSLHFFAPGSRRLSEPGLPLLRLPSGRCQFFQRCRPPTLRRGHLRLQLMEPALKHLMRLPCCLPLSRPGLLLELQFHLQQLFP